MTTPAPIKFPVKNAKGQDTGLNAQPTQQQLDDIAKNAGDKALSNLKNEAGTFIKNTLGVTSLDLKEVVPALRNKLRDPEVDIEVGTKTVPTPHSKIPGSTITEKTHRYTVIVPDIDEKSVLNLGSGAEKHELPDPGITARTKSHIHLHAFDAANASMIALGGPTILKTSKITDPHKVLTSNEGISAVTNGHLWGEAQKVVNLASHTDQTIVRAHEKMVRVQADAANVEVGAAKKVIVGGVDSVNIVSNGTVDLGDNKYGQGFGETLSESAKIEIDKDGISLLDWLSSGMTTWQAYRAEDQIYKKGTLEKETKKNDKPKIITDALKVISSASRQVASKLVGGKVSISAATFASMTGRVAASMYGNLSATVASAVSASVVGGTAGLKGLVWTSVWAGNGVSVRTLLGSASLRSDKGKVAIDGAKEVNVVSAGGVNIGGDGYAELKSGSGSVYVGSSKFTKVCAGSGSGMGVLVSATQTVIGTMTNPDKSSASPTKEQCIVMSTGGTGAGGKAIQPGLAIQSQRAVIRAKNNEWHVVGKKAYIL
jgi:hypothetical protein